jgi:hypothetical protein
VAEGWVRMMKNSIAGIAPHFVTSRMMNDYNHRFYSKLHERYKKMAEDEFEMAKRISVWKKRMIRAWNNISVIDCVLFANGSDTYEMDHPYNSKVVLDLNEIAATDVGVELIVTENGERLISTHPFTLDASSVDKAEFKASITINQPGTFNYGIRIYPKNKHLPHRQDINLVKWI